MSVDLKSLKSIHYLSGLSPAELNSIRDLLSEKTVEIGEIFLIEGHWSDFLYFLISGVVKVYKTSVNGKEQVVHLATKGESLNDVSTFVGCPNTASMLAMTPVLLYEIRKDNLRNIISCNPRVAMNTIDAMANRVQRNSNLIKDLSFTQVTGRLAKMLLKHTGEEAKGWPQLTQQDMADMVGTTREVVNRSLRTLEENGAIRLERHGIVILDKKTLNDIKRVSS